MRCWKHCPTMTTSTLSPWVSTKLRINYASFSPNVYVCVGENNTVVIQMINCSSSRIVSKNEGLGRKCWRKWLSYDSKRHIWLHSCSTSVRNLWNGSTKNYCCFPSSPAPKSFMKYNVHFIWFARLLTEINNAISAAGFRVNKFDFCMHMYFN